MNSNNRIFEKTWPWFVVIPSFLIGTGITLFRIFSKMSDMKLNDIINTFDNDSNTGFDEYEVATALRTIQSKDQASIVDIALLAELMAFGFVENYQDEKTGWGTYFGPMMALNDGKGKIMESPSIKLITPEIIDYWERRAYESRNPIIKARYAGLVWDFKKTISGEKASIEICKLYIKSLLEVANGNFHKYESSIVTKLKRALQLSITINDRILIDASRDAILNFERNGHQDTRPSLWGYSFDLLIGNRKVNLSKEDEVKIIFELEEKLNRLTSKEQEGQRIDPWAAETAAVRLANYYKTKGKLEDVKRVILNVGEALDVIVDEASAMQASGWLENLYKLYIRFNLHEDAESVLLKIREIGPKVSSELEEFSQIFEIPKTKSDEHVALMVKGGIEDVLKRIAIVYIPNKEKAKEQVTELAKKDPFPFIIGHQLQDGKGRVVATIGPLEKDLEGHIIRQISRNLPYSSFFLRIVLAELTANSKLSKVEILNFLKKSPVITSNSLDIIERGLDAYFQNDFLVAIHLMVPQIEESIRNIVELGGGIILKASRSGGYHLKTFDEILRDQILIDVLGEDNAHYFRIIFTDQRGWNLRNDVCHGLAQIFKFNQMTADRVLHTLLCIGLVQLK